ncbi:MAG TPA: ATP-binding cassette domain-containing protein [Streptosporangiaceae bacterium]|nr:ATP-binding cassette domain-containing protein [Streptosporangiaceae bacterium]
MPEEAIHAEGLVKSFKRTRALRGIDLTVRTGTVLALLGRNGAGKSTAVRILTTLTRPDAGSAIVAGFDVIRSAERVRARIGVTGQGPTVDELLTARQNLVVIGRMFHLSPQQARLRAGQLLEEFGLADAAGRLARTYSGGMRRRLDLAASMIAAPPVMFLDEPTTGLDPVSRAQIWQAIREMVTQSGTSVLLTSQYLEEAEQLADDVTVINDGLVAASGTPRQLRESVGQANVRVVLRDADSSAASRLGALLGPTARIDGRVVTLAAPDGLGSLADVVARLHPMAAEVDDVALQRPSLEEAFTILTAAGPSEDGAQPELAIAGAR